MLTWAPHKATGPAQSGQQGASRAWESRGSRRASILPRPRGTAASLHLCIGRIDLSHCPSNTCSRDCRASLCRAQDLRLIRSIICTRVPTGARWWQKRPFASKPLPLALGPLRYPRGVRRHQPSRVARPPARSKCWAAGKQKLPNPSSRGSPVTHSNSHLGRECAVWVGLVVALVSLVNRHTLIIPVS